MRLILSLATFHLAVFSFAQIPTNSARFDVDSFNNAKINEATGKPFPTFIAENEQGKINNDSLRGKVVLINFWFEGCHPCLAEFGALNELAEKLKGNKDFEFISFTWDNAETIKRVKEEYQLQFQVFYSKECNRLNLRLGYPTTMILDRQGIIKYVVNGGSLDPQKAREFVMNTLLPEVQQQL